MRTECPSFSKVNIGLKILDKRNDGYHNINTIFQELEFGDFLFSVVNYARFLDIDPEIALEKSNKKFTKRFEKIEHEVRKRGLSLGEVNIKDLNLLWENAKK